ncbi:MAG: Mbeg1-like protein [Erysipelotrichaceae bacterium]
MNLFVYQHLCYLAYFDVLKDALPLSVNQLATFYLKNKKYRNDRFLIEMATSLYQDYWIMDYVNDNKKSGLVLYRISHKQDTILCFRGSESGQTSKKDGWQDWEDNLDTLFEVATNQQTQALIYINRLVCDPLILCGHSKGGNLALYCALKIKGENLACVSQVITFNAPGISMYLKKQNADRIQYLRKNQLVYQIENEYDLVSSLFLPIADPFYVKSKNKITIDTIKKAHQLDNYKESGKGFVYVDHKKPIAIHTYLLFNELLNLLPKENIRMLIQPIYYYFYFETSEDELVRKIQLNINYYHKLLHWYEVLDKSIIRYKYITHKHLSKIMK